MQFLISSDLEAGSSPQIKRILSGKDVRIASAFLGSGAEDVVQAGSRLICDIGMGGTNPHALKALSEKLGENLRWLPDFHAKVYLSDEGCVVGSANLSSRGVGFLSPARLIEASVLMDSNEEAARSAADWYEVAWNESSIVGPREIAWALATWNSDKRGAPVGKRKYGSFLEALEDQTGVAREWKYILTREQLSPGFAKAAAEKESEIIRAAGWQPEGKIDVYANLKGADDMGGYYIGLHRGGGGRLHLLALRFIGKMDLEDIDDEDGSGTAYYFAILPWSVTGMPRLEDADLKAKSDLSSAIRDAKRKRFGRAIDAGKFAGVLRAGK